jgi:hypothetical protein
MVSMFVGFSILQMVFLFLIFLLNNVYKENMTFLSLHPLQNGCNGQIQWLDLHAKNCKRKCNDLYLNPIA